METKPLLYGLIGFFIGGLLVSVAATSFNISPQHNNNSMMSEGMEMSTSDLNKNMGDSFDEKFLSAMIVHHEGAIDMAKLVKSNAKHDELKKFGQDIIDAQSKEIDIMKTWQREWNYKSTSESQRMHE